MRPEMIIVTVNQYAGRKNTVLWYLSVSGPFDTKYIQSSSSPRYCQHRNADGDWPFCTTEWNIFNFTPLQFFCQQQCLAPLPIFSSPQWNPGVCHSSGELHQRTLPVQRPAGPAAHQTAGRHVEAGQAAAAAVRAQPQGHGTAGMRHAARVAPSKVYYTVSFNFIQIFTLIRNKWFSCLTQYYQEEILRSGWSEFEYFVFTFSLTRFSDYFVQDIWKLETPNKLVWSTRLCG